jgi:hypothetical protein
VRRGEGQAGEQRAPALAGRPGHGQGHHRDLPLDPPTAGTFTLSQGRLSVYSKSCGPETGDYDVVVTGEPEAGKAVLNLSAVDDPCEARRRYLTVDPWVYANS